MQSLSINTSKIDKTALYEGRTGKFLNLTLMENKEGPDQYQNDGFIIQDIGKERRDAGERGPIIGNWKHIKRKDEGRPTSQGGAKPPAQSNDDDFDDVPF